MNPTTNHAPPRFPCTACRMSHGGCAANYIAGQPLCCETCHHVNEKEGHHR